jgi:hypothetical protein
LEIKRIVSRRGVPRAGTLWLGSTIKLNSFLLMKYFETNRSWKEIMIILKALSANVKDETCVYEFRDGRCIVLSEAENVQQGLTTELGFQEIIMLPGERFQLLQSDAVITGNEYLLKI